MPIPQIVLMGISLLLKTNLAVSLMAVAVTAKSDDPFHQIPNIKTDKEHLALLQRVDILVIPIGST